MKKFITYDKLYTLYAAKQRQRCDFAYVYMISNRMLAIVSIPKWHAGLVAFPLNWLKPCKRHQYQSNFLQFLGILSSILIKYRRRDEFIIKPLCFFSFCEYLCSERRDGHLFPLSVKSGGNFRFTLMAYEEPLLSPVIPNAAKLDTEILFNAEASIQSLTPSYPLTGSYFHNQASLIR